LLERSNGRISFANRTTLPTIDAKKLARNATPGARTILVTSSGLTTIKDTETVRGCQGETASLVAYALMVTMRSSSAQKPAEIASNATHG
jgi:hypothetical protein